MDMNINSVNYTGYISQTTAQTNSQGETSITEKTLSYQYSATAVHADSFVKSEQPADGAEAITYSPPKKLSKEQVEALERQLQESMKSLAYKMLGAQAEIATKGDGGIDYMALAESLGMGTTPETAAEAISENGMWGVNAVSTRLMDMAMALSKGDPAMAAELREAVQKGFEAVGAIETLPQVCQDTYAETMRRFDYWEEHGSLEGYGGTTQAGEAGAASGGVSVEESVSVVVSETVIET